MGLDVYLERCDNVERARKLEAEYWAEYDAIWNEYPGHSEMTPVQIDEARARYRALATKLGLNEDGEYPDREGVRLDSAKYPDHLFKIGYWRSSYNQGGINNYLRRRQRATLWVLNPNHEHEFTPDWDKALADAKLLLGSLKEIVGLPAGTYNVITVRNFSVIKEVKSDAQALEMFWGELKQSPEWRSYSNNRGYFFLNGIDVRAVILGEEDVYIVHKDSDVSWYVHALEIVVETIEYVLDQPDPETYYLVWSS